MGNNSISLEGVMRYLVIFFSIFLFYHNFLITDVFAKKKSSYLKIVYYKEAFGHIHRNPSRYSSSLTTISCGHPLKLLPLKKGKEENSHWAYIKTGPYTGHVLNIFLSSKRPRCFSDVHSKFFDNMNLSITDMYYFGRLYDQYVIGQTRRP